MCIFCLCKSFKDGYIFVVRKSWCPFGMLVSSSKDGFGDKFKLLPFQEFGDNHFWIDRNNFWVLGNKVFGIYCFWSLDFAREFELASCGFCFLLVFWECITFEVSHKGNKAQSVCNN